MFVSLLLAGGCANGDFGRVRPLLVNDNIHDWVGHEAVGSISGPASEFRLTDDERLVRDLAYPLIEPPYDRHRWYSVLGEYGLSRTHPQDAKPFDRTAYWMRLDEKYRRSEASAYSQLITDARNDTTRLEPFFAASARILDLDRKRGESITHVSHTSGVSDYELNNAQARANENAAIVSWVCLSLHQRAASYRYALEHLVIAVPSRMAAETERSLNFLQRQTGQYCLGPKVRAVVAKD